MSLLTAVFLALSIATTVLGRPSPVVLSAVPVVQQVPRPYEFGFDFGDGLGMTQHRAEIADGTGAVRGKYGFTDPQGLFRNVEYIADVNGYRAVIRSNEPGATSQSTGDAVFLVRSPPPGVIAQGLRRPVPLVAV
ncbi:cuticle protein 16.8 [Trichonephila inaurata madagascariensis]|uniref:Cuticle protein 16.8 n=1 Tax=Trichonephila inaurata madagascariensis TaxID=2747483 RepID=A0A8X7C551_9ARAC|nr:cuticle protein 16.8 [Trichonephila inaurata madagascariensis]